MRYRLADNHPAMKAIEKLFNFMEKEGINISVEEVTKLWYNGEMFILRDIEGDNYKVDHFPYEMEYKLTFEKEDNQCQQR